MKVALEWLREIFVGTDSLDFSSKERGFSDSMAQKFKGVSNIELWSVKGCPERKKSWNLLIKFGLLLTLNR